ncbi:hypothetical protein IV203_019622 [Nitzschia inconspicua]|uniref:Uncharacterized protein n=1 Tax=Nitzschia inconspicua TaxID=303405 RepID=A0A9K3Q4G6_9STRA|nr:hypothetical protein IV203_019622 [Nitzschia inconspicua]
MSRAFLEYEPAKLEKVKGKLMERGWTDEEISATMFYNPIFFNRRVERIALPPRQLYYRVRAVMVAFGKRVDSKIKQPLFNKEAWKKAKNLLDEILEGFYSDPPGFDFYTFELDKNGQVKKDSYGIALLFSCRGTSHVESVHRQYNTMFRHMSGLEMGDALFRERRHRNNIDVARRRYLNVPEFGHYDTCQGLQNKLDETVAAMKAADVSWTPKLTADMKFLCEAWGVKLPFLPVNGKDEFRVFSRIMFRADFARFDSEQMAHLWMEYVNGYTVYPKLPLQLREYHKAGERNKRIKRAEERMKTDSEMLKSFLESKVSIEIEERRSLAVSENEYQQNLYSQEIG